MKPIQEDMEPYQFGDIKVSPLLAHNPSPFTFEGTITHIIGTKKIIILDPGPKISSHLLNIEKQIDGREVAAILVTHTHLDHSPLATLLKKKVNAPIMGCMPYKSTSFNSTSVGLDASHDQTYRPDKILTDGDVLDFGELSLEVVNTPGHSANHICFAIKNKNIMFSGDHVMGWSTTIVAPPDGNMAEYINSLDKILKRDEDYYIPAHGNPITNAKKYTQKLKGHRLQREALIIESMKKYSSKKTISLEELLDYVYTEVPQKLKFAASLSLKSHLIKLINENKVIEVKNDEFILL